VDQLRKTRLEQLLGAIDAFIDAMRFSARGEDIWRFWSYREHMRTYNNLYAVAGELVVSDIPTYRYDLEAVTSPGSTIAMQQKGYFDSVLVNAQMLRALVQQQLGPTTDKVMDIANFVAANLRRGFHSQPENERQVQDVLETLFIGRGLQKGLDYDRETGRVKVSVKESIPDFILPKLGLAVEVKFVETATRLRGVVDEINADIRSYGTAYAHLLFVVYDVGQVRDEEQFKRGLEDSVGIRLVVVKH
jgi:hypothetical protein